MKFRHNLDRKLGRRTKIVYKRETCKMREVLSAVVYDTRRLRVLKYIANLIKIIPNSNNYKDKNKDISITPKIRIKIKIKENMITGPPSSYLYSSNAYDCFCGN